MATCKYSNFFSSVAANIALRLGPDKRTSECKLENSAWNVGFIRKGQIIKLKQKQKQPKPTTRKSPGQICVSPGRNNSEAKQNTTPKARFAIDTGEGPTVSSKSCRVGRSPYTCWNPGERVERVPTLWLQTIPQETKMRKMMSLNCSIC